MKELVGIILLTVLVVFGSRNSNTDVSLVGTSPKLFDVCQVSTGNPDYRNKELFIFISIVRITCAYLAYIK